MIRASGVDETNPMQRIHSLAPTRAAVAATLQEWHTSLSAVHESAEAEIYACVVALVMEALGERASLQSLIDAYCLPDRVLRHLVTDFCADGEVQLRPRWVMGAACALRLRQLVAVAQ